MDQLSGMLWFHFGIAVLLTTGVARVILAWYRRAVARSMRITAGTAAELAPCIDRDLAARAPHGRPERQAGRTAAAETRLRRRAAVVYGLGGLAAAAVMTVVFLRAHGDEPR